MLWIFNPGGNSTAVPKDLVITWSTGQQITYIGWSERGQGAWQLTVPLVGTFPPQSAYVDYSGTLGNHAVLTISGCNESTITGTTTNTTTTSTTATTTTSSTTTATTATTTTIGTTTSTIPTTTATTTPPGTTTIPTTTGATTAPGTTTHPATTPATPPCVPTLTVNKVADSATVTVGGTASFTVTVGNTSASCTATNVVLYEQPGTGLIVAGVTLNGASCSQGPVSCEVGTLKAGASVAVKVTSTALNTAGTYTNCIRLQSNNTGPQTSCATVTVAAAVTTTPTTTPAPTTTTTSTPAPKPKPPAHHAKPPVHHKQHGTTTPVPQADTK